MVSDEQQEEKTQINAQVTKLDVKVNNVVAQNELETFLTKVKQENSLGNFLQVLPRYVRCYSCRERTFLYFKTKYPEQVVFRTEHSTNIEICNRQKSGIHFTVCWDIHVGNNCHVIPQLDAFAFFSGDIEKEDDEVVKSTPEMFRKMLSQCGIEKSIELLISIVNE